MALIHVEGFEGIVPRHLVGVTDTSDEMIRYMDLYYQGTDGTDQGGNQKVCLQRDKFNQGHAFSFGEGGASQNNYLEYNTPSAIALANTFYIGFRIKTQLTLKNSFLLDCYGESNIITSHLNVRVSSTGFMTIYRGGALLATTSTAVLTANTWHYIEFGALINNTTGTYELKVDGVSELSATGVDTEENPANGPVNRFRIRSGAPTTTDVSEQRLIDDLYVLDSTGTTNNTFLGPIQVYNAMPAESGTSGDWQFFGSATFTKPKVKSLREIPADETTGVEAATGTTKRQTYNLDKFHTDNIRGVTVRTRVKNVNTTVASTIKSVVKSGATSDVAQDSVTIDNSDSSGAIATYGEDPNTSALWTKDNLNAAEFGVEVD